MKKSNVIFAEVHLGNKEVVTGYIKQGNNRILVYNSCALQVTVGSPSHGSYEYKGHFCSLTHWDLVAIGSGNYTVTNVKHIPTDKPPLICLKEGTWWHKFKDDRNVHLMEPHQVEGQL